MSSFTSPLVVRHIDGKHWEIMRPFTYHVTSKESNEQIKVPIGYITDFASIPKIFWFIIGSPSGKHGKAAVIHDYLYSIKTYSRKRSDQIFYEAMSVSKVSANKRKIIYYAVRWFGWAAWRSK